MTINSSTRMIKVEPVEPTTDPQNPVAIGSYPVYLWNARQEYPNIMFSDEYSNDEALIPQGYVPVYPTDQPAGDVVDYGTPEKREDGKYYDTWTVREFTEEELAANLEAAKQIALSQLDSARYNAYAKGYEDKVGDTTNLYSLTAENQQLLTALRILADAETNADREFTLRTVDNRSVKAKKDEVQRVTTAVLEHCLAILEQLWELADEVVAATKIADIPTIPESVA